MNGFLKVQQVLRKSLSMSLYATVYCLIYTNDANKIAIILNEESILLIQYYIYLLRMISLAW